MIRNSGLFVLLGTKPMCLFDTSSPTPQSEEEFSKTADNYHHRFEFQKLWSKWITTYPTIKNPRFMFINLMVFEQDYSDGLFINVPTSIFILTKYRETFLKETQVNYDPDQILETISNPNSKFWKSVFSNHYLFGLLMGYGEIGSFYFDWHRKHNIENPSISDFELRLADYFQAFALDKVTIEDLPLPPSVMFTVSDATKEKYRQERTAIFQYFKNKNLYSGILSILEEQPVTAP